MANTSTGTRSGRQWPALLIIVAVAVVLAGSGIAYIASRPSMPAPATAAGTPTAQPATGTGTSTSSPASQPATGDWTTYMYDGARSGFNAGETRLSPDNAGKLKLTWQTKLGGIVAAQPIVKGDTVYVGAWDGFFYALNKSDGSIKWKVDLGRTTSQLCVPQTAGITSAAAVTDKAVYVGGGDENIYALNPSDGSVIWKFRNGDNSPEGGNYNWASPLVYNNRVYYGTSAFCDKPFPPGKIWGINADTGKADQQFNFLPEGQLGGGIWTSPTVDQATGEFYVTVGSGDYYVPYNYSMARLDPNTLKVVDSWQIPIDQQVFDGDWGTTPTLFKGKDGTLMVGASAKNGYYYAFKAHDIGAGPTWSLRIADGGECPQCGEGAISSSVYAYNTVYVAGGYLSLGVAQKFAGTVHAFDPTTGAIKWIHPTSGSVVPALAAANGLVVAAGGDTLEVMRADNGQLVWEYALDAPIYAAPSISGGTLYAASTSGTVYAFSAGPYPDKTEAYKVGAVGSNPPGFTPFREPVQAAKLPGEEQCFSDTGTCVRGDFLTFWRDKGGLERFGPAVTGELDEAGRTVQYFRDAALALYPSADGKGNEVRYASLDFRLFYYTPKDDHFEPAAPVSGTQFVEETHHNLPEPFYTYWKTHGDVANLGYPVSEPFDEYHVADDKTYHVQYFERSRLEIVKDADGTEHVQFGALGLERYKQRYGKLP